MKKLHFGSKAGYRRWTAYEHIHGLEKDRGPYPEVIIRGRKHRVMHKR